MTPLPDGRYDIFIVDARDIDDEATDAAAIALELTVTSGEHKGETLQLQAQGMGRDSIDLLGLPGTLVVTDGSPRLHVEG